MSLSPRQRARRVCLLACHAMRNLVYSRSGWKDGELVKKSEFWVTVNGNFVDATVTEWCKLFGDLKGKHCWRKVIADCAAFEAGLLARLQVTQEQFDDYTTEMLVYRDKFVAHLDDLEQMQIPKLELAEGSLGFLFDYMLQEENPGGYYNGLPASATAYIDQSEAEAEVVYK